MIDGNLALQNDKHDYRTRAKAGEVVNMPEKYAIITLKKYQNAMGLFQEGNAYLQPMDNVDGLEYKDGKLYFKGFRYMKFTEKKIIKIRWFMCQSVA